MAEPRQSAFDFLRAEVARLRAIEQAATPDWRLRVTGGAWEIEDATGLFLVATRPPCSSARTMESIANARLMMAARSALPALLGLLEQELQRHGEEHPPDSEEVECACGSAWWPCASPRIVSAARALGWRGND